jgi:hypothetical protein
MRSPFSKIFALATRAGGFSHVATAAAHVKATNSARISHRHLNRT